MPLVQTRGAASAQGFGEFAQAATAANYIEDMFSTFLWTGNDSSQTITNGIDLSTKGGLVWIKSRAAYGHILSDTNRGTGKFLSSNTTDAQGTDAQDVTAFNTTGFAVGNNSRINNSSFTYASWTFRKQPKFFGVVTWTGDGTGNRTIPHNLGSTPGFVVIKRTSSIGNWLVYQRAVTSPNANWWRNYGYLDATDSFIDFGSNAGLYQSPDSTNLYIGSYYNGSGDVFVAYLFAHDAGGFGLTGADNVISCGSFSTGAGGGATVTLGYEPQWLMIKSSSDASAWYTFDSMRGWIVGGSSRGLSPNTANAEFNFGSSALPTNPTATGFTFTNGFFVPNETWIYIAIRRGPMKVPTTGTSVFSPNAQTGAGTTAGQTLTTSFPVDLEISSGRATNSGAYFIDRLRGGQNYMTSSSTAAEVNFTGHTPLISFANNTGILDANYGSTSNAYVAWNFRRAPSFFDEICYTGTGSATTVTHNLGVVPELMIVKCRNVARAWAVYSSALGATKNLYLNASNAEQTSASYWNDTAPTASVFSVKDSGDTNFSTWTYVAYLFATCAGVSKVGSYTGTATTLQIDCGFTAGARFVLIKRTDSTGDWYVWDTARGIVSGNDSYLLLNSTAAEVTNTDYIDTYSAGFEISSTAPAAINASGGTYIFLAIA